MSIQRVDYRFFSSVWLNRELESFKNLMEELDVNDQNLITTTENEILEKSFVKIISSFLVLNIPLMLYVDFQHNYKINIVLLHK